MAEFKNAIIMGHIYDPDTDCQIVLLKVTAKDFDNYQIQIDEEMKE